MQNVRYLLPILALAAILSACGGGGSSSVSQGDIAVVGKEQISLADFNAEMQQAKESYQQSGQTFPKVGTSAYQSIKNQAVTLLVQHAERQSEADAEGIKVTDGDVQKRIDSVKKQYFKGKEKPFLAALKKAKLTLPQFEKDVRQQLLEQKLYDKITKDVTVPDIAAQLYYQQNMQKYSQQQSRDVEYMLIKKKALADSLYAQLKANPALFCSLAKKYSGDPSTKNNCGKATFTKGQTVAAFDQVLFSEPTNQLHAPIYDPTSYKAYFLVKPTSDVKPAKVTPFNQVKDSIKQTLLQQQKSDAVNKWSADIQKKYCSGSKIKYQVGYEPNPGPCTSATATTTT
jgi:parvulin-like peptidyl-prolyl isomerase